VLEITKVWAGPYAGKLLAFLGAEVIKIESVRNMDEMRAYGGVDIDNAPIFMSLNPEIMSVQVNMKSPEGIEHLRGMIAQSDIVINNIKPGAMERAGLDYEDLRAIRQDLISVSLKMHGNDGPLAYQTGFAPSFAALGGMNFLVGYDGEAPRGVNMSYGDSTAGAALAYGALAALMHRERTGEGQFVDVSAVESMASLVGDSIFEYALTGRIPKADANRHADMAPHGAYPCLDGEWISIAAATEAQWQALAEVLGKPEMATDPRFATLADRQANLPALDAALGMLTGTRPAAMLAPQLRQAGVPAHKSMSSRDVVCDPRLWERGLFRTVQTAAGGKRPIVGPAWHFQQAPVTVARGAPNFGEHNHHVYCDMLGLSAAELEDLKQRNVAQ
jgi:crotonobetainyl-CoA:carnitine CoA-transferase CaiB-like acyl-CoA transferase